MTLCQSAIIFFQTPFPLSAFALKFLLHSLPEPLTVFVVLSESLAKSSFFNCEPQETHGAGQGVAAFHSANTFLFLTVIVFLVLLDPPKPT